LTKRTYQSNNAEYKYPTGDIDYEAFGISGLYKKPFSPHFKGIAKAGYANINNSASNGITFRQVEGQDVFLGLGGEYNVNKHLSVRGEYKYFDEDIQLLSIGLN